MELSKRFFRYFYERICNNLIQEEFEVIPDILKKKSKAYTNLWTYNVNLEGGEIYRLGSYFTHIREENTRYFYNIYREFKKLKDDSDTLDIDNNCYVKALIYLKIGKKEYAEIKYNFNYRHINNDWNSILDNPILLARLHRLFFLEYQLDRGIYTPKSPSNLPSPTKDIRLAFERALVKPINFIYISIRDKREKSYYVTWIAINETNFEDSAFPIEESEFYDKIHSIFFNNEDVRRATTFRHPLLQDEEGYLIEYNDDVKVTELNIFINICFPF